MSRGTRGRDIGKGEEMQKQHKKALNELLEVCWEIRKANREGGDISAGQFLDYEFERRVDDATWALGCYGIESDKPPLWNMLNVGNKPEPREPVVKKHTFIAVQQELNVSRKEEKKMKTDQFEKLLESRLVKMKQTLGAKAREYATDSDRLHNFRVAAGVAETSVEKALWGMALKHLVSVIDMIEGRTKVTPELVDEKIGDLINYLVLLEAVFTEASAGARPAVPPCTLSAEASGVTISGEEDGSIRIQGHKRIVIE